MAHLSAPSQKEARQDKRGVVDKNVQERYVQCCRPVTVTSWCVASCKSQRKNRCKCMRLLEDASLSGTILPRSEPWLWKTKHKVWNWWDLDASEDQPMPMVHTQFLDLDHNKVNTDPPPNAESNTHWDTTTLIIWWYLLILERGILDEDNDPEPPYNKYGTQSCKLQTPR